jgi:hypothetical protein
MPGLFDAARTGRFDPRSTWTVQWPRSVSSATIRRKSRAEYEAENPFIEGDME